jgi:retinol dehydrogenase-12
MGHKGRTHSNFRLFKFFKNVQNLIFPIGIDMNWDDLQSEKKYSITFAYAQAKLANILFTIELARRLEGTNVTSVSLCPGAVKTDIWREFSRFDLKTLIFYLVQPIFWLIMKDSKQGAQTSIYCACDDSIPGLNGKYFTNCRPKAPSKEAQNLLSARRLWEISENLLGMN